MLVMELCIREICRLSLIFGTLNSYKALFMKLENRMSLSLDMNVLPLK